MSFLCLFCLFLSVIINSKVKLLLQNSRRCTLQTHCFPFEVLDLRIEIEKQTFREESWVGLPWIRRFFSGISQALVVRCEEGRQGKTNISDNWKAQIEYYRNDGNI